MTDDAITTLEHGGTLIYPTETCYGIGCDATNPDAVRQIYDIKQRPREKKLTCIVADRSMADQYGDLTTAEQNICDTLMPGPLTLVTEKHDRLPSIVNHKFAFRIPAHERCRRLSRELGAPIIATSANRSGQPASYSIDEIDPTVREQVDTIIDAGTLEQTPSSTVAELTATGITIHRNGPVTKEQIEAVIDQ